MPVLTIITQKGGTGKTVTAGSFAQAAASTGKKVLAIDLDPQGNLSFMMGATRSGPGSYGLLKGTSIRDTLQHTSQDVDVIPAPKILATIETSRGSAWRLRKAIEPVRDSYDLIIIDTPSKAGELQYNALQATDDAIFPLHADTFSVQSFYDVLEDLEAIRGSNPDLNCARILITMYSGVSNIAKQMKAYIEEQAAAHEIPFLGTVRKGARLEEAIAFQESVFKYSPNSNPAKTT